MSESQSRYSICERIVTKKLQIMDEIQNIDGDIEQKRLSILQKIRESEDEEMSLKERLRDRQNRYKQEIESLKKEVEILESNKEARITSNQDKLIELDNALTLINEISKSATRQEVLE